MSTGSDSSNKQLRRALPVVDVDDGQACSTCRSNEWIWEEEVELVRAMNHVKTQVRAARAEGDDERVRSLRNDFASLRTRMEKVRRQRLDSLGHYDYD